MEVLELVTTLMIGLYAGSLLTEGMILVPYWRRMAPQDFFRLHGDVGPSLFRYFALLTAAAMGMSFITAVAAFDPLAWQSLAALLCSVALAIFFIHFRKANAAFANRSLTHDELGPALERWSAWHWTRTLVIVGAFAASIVAIL
ncbi:MAG: hypothetical protein AAGJ32_07025 [Pseudomonadota bacterium]